MTLHYQDTAIDVDGCRLEGKLVSSSPALPGVLLVHGWDSDQHHYEHRAHDIAALGCVCMRFDLRGHGAQAAQHETVTREDNLNDVLAAYDVLQRQPNVDPKRICLIGTSYGGYLATIVTALRQVRWLALRVPALYPDRDWHTPKAALARDVLDAYRHTFQAPAGNRALTACERFRGHVLVVESGDDSTVPHPAISSYLSAFHEPCSLTYRAIQGADHALSDEASQREYDQVLYHWVAEMILRARTESVAD